MPYTPRLPMSRRGLLAGAATLPLLGRAAAADAYPSKPIRVVLPGPAGGIIDVAIRSLSDVLAADLGQPIVVDPRPGGNGVVAGQIVVAAPKDGYTVELTVSAYYALPFLMKVPFDVVEDFTPIAMVGVSAAVLCVAKSLPIRTIDELVAYARQNPQALNYLNPGNGTPSHLVLEQVRLDKKVELASVPYKGLPPGVQDLLGERIQLGLISAPLVLGHIRSGALRAIAVSGGARLPELPGVATFREQGYGGLEVQSAIPLLGPKGLPDPIVERLNGAFAKALADPQVRSRLAAACIQPQPMTVAEMKAWAKNENQRLGRLITQLGIKADGSD
ncbi:Bug family tripartite tricarboxylate transporter substrate binding protein [Reyranella sp.]|uniref:Bug family tripartite tricarboxylate transporter substrate binding protein n=1 Tax=Reyranella sp. TaxID=1929291 RepID=UPI0037852984